MCYCLTGKSVKITQATWQKTEPPSTNKIATPSLRARHDLIFISTLACGLLRYTTMMLNHYPSISDDEFAEACKIMEQRCHDNLHGTNWLSVRSHDRALEIKQCCTTDGKVEDDTWFRNVKSVGVHTESEVNGKEDGEADDGDDADTIDRHSEPLQNRPAVDFSIVLSPTYRVPVLWFTLSSNRVARVQDLEEIYSRVVAPGSHESLRGIGIMGGISLANHPITDRPAFFVHPCNTPEAMVALNEGSNLDPFHYLLLWFGVVGAGVGLHVPAKVAA